MINLSNKIAEDKTVIEITSKYRQEGFSPGVRDMEVIREIIQKYEENKQAEEDAKGKVAKPENNYNDMLDALKYSMMDIKRPRGIKIANTWPDKATDAYGFQKYSDLKAGFMNGQRISLLKELWIRLVGKRQVSMDFGPKDTTTIVTMYNYKGKLFMLDPIRYKDSANA